MSLQSYRHKRNFTATPEPRGSARKTKGELSFVVQKHAASRLHYDFRLELDGTLKSWAVPKGPSMDPKDKRLAVHVEDHPIEYAEFEGTIPPEQYGAGTVIVWDRGTWIPQGDALAAYRAGRLKFRLRGEKLRGGWALVRMRARGGDEGKENWLLMKERDEEAHPGQGDVVLEEQPWSVTTGRTVDDMAQSRPPRSRTSNRERPDEPNPGEEIRAKACSLGLEGVIGKRADSAYVGRRTRDWIKLKCRRRQEMIIAGYTSGTGMRKALGSLILAVHESDGTLRYAGRVGTGFNEAVLRRVLEALAPLASDKPTVEGAPHRVSGRIQWVRPELVAEISFAEWTHDGIVRQASFEGLREDKKAADVTRERAQSLSSAEVPSRAATRKTSSKATRSPTTKRPSKATRASSDASTSQPASSRSTKNSTVVAGVKVTHPDRVLFADLGITKLDIARYYERVAPNMLKYAGGRPLALLRCPDGPDGACFFQKHAEAGRIPGVDMLKIREGGGVHSYVMANRATALVGLAQMNVLELHLWGARADDVERPDTVIIDLDPDPGLSFARVVKAAALARTLLEELGLKCFLKTTGGKGLHVVLPVTRRHTWDEVKAFASGVAERMATAMPERFTATLAKDHRTGKIFIDYLRNARGSLAVAPYSVRARPGATVATPLSWEELEPKLDPSKFNVRTIPERLEKLGDPWDGYARVRQTLTAASKRLRSS